MPNARERIAADEAEARRRLPSNVYDYFAGGSGAEVSLQESTAAWQSVRFAPRILRDVSRIDTSVELFGLHLPSPVAVAPMGYLQLLHPDGEVAVASGADGHLLVLSSRSDRPVEEVAASAGPWWLQVYVTVDGAISDALVDRAVAAGASALVLTGDTPYPARKARAGRPRELRPEAEQDPGATFADIGRLAERSGLPVLVKGVLRPDDAVRSLEAGAAGLIVSNHGGRQLDRSVATAYVLGGVVEAAAGAPVLVDGGIRTGYDVLAALALGARAVLVGRPVAWALAAAGPDGVRSVLTDLAAEYAHVLGLAGCAGGQDVGRDLLAAT